MTQVEIDIREIKEDLKEIKETLKKMQEDINRLENNFLYHGVYEYGPAVNNLPSTQACSEEEISLQLEFNYNK